MQRCRETKFAVPETKFASQKRYDVHALHERSEREMTDRDGVGGVDATRLNLFATPLLIATLPDAHAINTELKRIILARESADASARSSASGWQSAWDLQQWGGAPAQRVLGFVRAIVEQMTVDRAGNRHQIAWRISCRANVNRQGHSNQFHTHPGALWSATYCVDDGGSATDASLGGELEIQDPRGVATVMYVPYLTFAGEDGAALGEAQRLRPQAGMAVVFPSWLSHGVRPYLGTRERISMAINFSLANV
jgi:uncharacterized protein (TIGR02466 family)